MAATVGKDGDVKIGTATVAYMDSWTLNATIDTAEISAFGSSNKAYASTLRGANVTFSGTLDRSDTDQADLMDQFEDATLASISIRLYTAAASYWAGSVKMTGLTINSQVGDKVSATFNGTVDGALTFTSS